jgi:hypothetical protein
MNKRKKVVVIYTGRCFGKKTLVHNWFMQSIPFLDIGHKIGIPTEGGMAIFEYRGKEKPEEPIITIEQLT